MKLTYSRASISLGVIIHVAAMITIIMWLDFLHVTADIWLALPRSRQSTRKPIQSHQTFPSPRPAPAFCSTSLHRPFTIVRWKVWPARLFSHFTCSSIIVFFVRYPTTVWGLVSFPAWTSTWQLLAGRFPSLLCCNCAHVVYEYHLWSCKLVNQSTVIF